jgi:hypothetical protein
MPSTPLQTLAWFLDAQKTADSLILSQWFAIVRAENGELAPPVFANLRDSEQTEECRFTIPPLNSPALLNLLC